MKTIKADPIKIIPVYNKQPVDKVKDLLGEFSIPDDVWQIDVDTTICLLLAINTAEEKYAGFIQIDRNLKNKKEAYISFSLLENEFKNIDLGKVIRKVTSWAYGNLGIPVFCIDTKKAEDVVVAAAKKANYVKRKGSESILEIDKDQESTLIELISII